MGNKRAYVESGGALIRFADEGLTVSGCCLRRVQRAVLRRQTAFQEQSLLRQQHSSALLHSAGKKVGREKWSLTPELQQQITGTH